MSGRDLLYPIRVVFHIDTTIGAKQRSDRLEAVGPTGGGLHSADRLDGRWAGELGRAQADWAERAGVGPRKGARARWSWATEGSWAAEGSGWAESAGELGHAFRAEPEARRNGSGVWTGSGCLGWTGPNELDRLDWVGPAQTEKMGRAPAFASGCRGDGAEDGDKHRLDYAVLGMGVTRLGSVEIEGGRGGWTTAACRRWQRDVSERGGEEEGEKRREGKNGGGGKEEKEKKRGRSGKKERAVAKIKQSETSDPRQKF
ncbi:hypothetical protein CRG98_039612 [Punica granatum]|uniref:Uncharacterized protein n=1 Tax=Punica granatum TaxID=22663 RepID=A0A2I0I7G5_PUNGR|nr:hypothetical protein CRG98_039612 [Punica granatum]